jgi:UPF0755 protein
MAKRKGQKGILLKVAIITVIMVVAIGSWKLYSWYKNIYWPNVSIDGEGSAYLFIPTGADLEDVAYLLESQQFIINRHSFEWLAEQKNYKGELVVPGKYQLKNRMSNDELINHLRAGNGRLEVKVTFHNIRTIEELAGKIARNLEPDSIELSNYLNRKDIIEKYGFNQKTFITLFIPNTYNFDWATNPEAIIQRLASEYKQFWNDSRREKARAIGLSQSEVATLASLVQAEQQRHKSERPRIAGLYLNRLKKGIRLQSDPTVIYATGDFTINRVLTKHLKLDSPYNTYLYAGLPPGPILIPDVDAIEAVLSAEKHNYIFMCAKEDFSGYHNFASTLREHNNNANRYRAALNKRKIYQ